MVAPTTTAHDVLDQAPHSGAAKTCADARYGHRVPDPIDVPPDRFVTLDGVRFHYLDWGGDGDPLLLLAGLGCTAHVFAELAPHLTDRFRVLALTRRGHGLTDQVRSGHALADAAEDARRLLDALGIDAGPRGRALDGRRVRCRPSPLAIPNASPASSTWTGPTTGPTAPHPGRPDEAASPDRFASYEDFVEFVRSLDPEFEKIWGPAFDAMFRALVDTHPDGSVTEKLSDAEAAPFDEAAEGVPAPLRRDHRTRPGHLRRRGPVEQGTAAKWRADCRHRFAAEIANGQVLEIRDASHYLFLDHRDDVLVAMRKFLA